MRNRKRIAAAAVAATVLVIGSACARAGSDQPHSADPAATLAAAVDTLRTESHRAAVRKTFDGGSLNFITEADPKQRGSHLDMRVAAGAGGTHIEVLYLGDNLWTRFASPNSGGQIDDVWMKVDLSKAPSELGRTYGRDSLLDAVFPALLTAGSGLTPTPEGRITGTVDTTKDAEVWTLSEDTLAAIGQKAKAVPFTVELTNQKITKLTMRLSEVGAAPSDDLDVVVDRYGQPLTVAEPLSAIDMPQELYETLGP